MSEQDETERALAALTEWPPLVMRWPDPLPWEVIERKGRYYPKINGKFQRDALWRKQWFPSHDIACHIARMWAHAETSADLRRELRIFHLTGRPIDRVLWERLRYLECMEAAHMRPT